MAPPPRVSRRRRKVCPVAPDPSVMYFRHRVVQAAPGDGAGGVGLGIEAVLNAEATGRLAARAVQCDVWHGTM